MIQSIDTYLYDEVKSRLEVILSECYIIDEALKGIDLEAKNAFKEAYTGPNKKEIPVTYEMPQTKNSFDARYVVSLGGASETNKSLGGIQGDYSTREVETILEIVEVKQAKDRLYFDTSKPVGMYYGSEDISFSSQDDFQVKDGVASFLLKNNEHCLDNQYLISYTSQTDEEDVFGTYQGTMMNESVGIIGISHNMDVARCLDAILKMILITMRDSLEEKNGLALQTVDFADLQPVVTNGDMQVFGRPCTIRYQITNSVSFDIKKRVNEIIARVNNEEVYHGKREERESHKNT